MILKTWPDNPLPISLSLHQIKEDIVIYFIDALVLEYKPNNPSIEVL